MNPFEAEELDNDEQRDKYKKAATVRERNAKLCAEIAQFGSEPDIANARLDHMLVAMTRAGIMTKEQYIELIYDWEVNLSRQLQSLRDNLVNRAEKIMAERKKKIATPAKGLHLPNGQVIQFGNKDE